MQIRNILVAAAIAALAVSGAAVAQTAAAKAKVDAAKATCTVGEQADGFLAFAKPTADPNLKAAVAEINGARAQAYREIAARNGVSPEAAGAAAFVQVVQIKMKPGECYKPNGGSWVKM